MNLIGKIKYSLDFFKRLATEKDGECLSEEYINCCEKLEFKCKEGHIWKARPYNIINDNTWCPVCNHRSPFTIKDMQKLAKKKNGICLSNTYVNSGTKLLWRCEKGHEWWVIQESIAHGSWCPICANRNIQLTITEMQELAKLKNGECLSEKYINSHTKLLWKCEKDHEWWAIPTNIKSGKWCPTCNESSGEKVIKLFLQKNNINFKSQKRFNDCKNIKPLPFDFHLINHNILIEYDGIQHFKPINFNNSSTIITDMLFQELIKRDAIKTKYCEDNNIPLIRIPYTEKNIEDFLKNKLIEFGLNLL